MFVLILGIIIVIADQLTKYWIRFSYDLGEIDPIVPGFMNLTYLRNTGAAWGMLDGYNTWLGVLSIAVLIGLIFFRRSFISNVFEHKIALGCLLGGIAGNLIDRLRLGYVTDFIDLHIKGQHWPSFNIADSAICIGVGIYILSALWLNQHPLRDNSANSAQENPPPEKE